MTNREDEAWDNFIAEEKEREEALCRDYLGAKYLDNLSYENVDLAFRVAGIQVTSECLNLMLKVLKALNEKGNQLTINEILAIK